MSQLISSQDGIHLQPESGDLVILTLLTLAGTVMVLISRRINELRRKEVGQRSDVRMPIAETNILLF